MRQAPDAGTARRGLGAYLRRGAIAISGFIALIWVVFLVNAALPGQGLFALGIRPRLAAGLVGVPIHPLLHGDLGHLLHNSIGIGLFGTLLFLREERHFWVVTLFGALLGGLGVWLFGRPALHIGASTVIFAYFGYLVSTGIFERRIGSLILSVVVFLLWGSVLLGVLPLQSGISWEGHLFGFLAGVLGARMLARPRVPRAV
jgi:membrane associated rhomboid family serine protease